MLPVILFQDEMQPECTCLTFCRKVKKIFHAETQRRKERRKERK
jgi:hypothetical protein